ncbi:MAG: hypothetical protein Kow00109_22850 [Acidobacteriota bacterium]
MNKQALGQIQLWFRIGYRNLRRNRRRSLLTASAIGLGLAALIVADAVGEGMLRNLVRTATRSFLGDGQIHRAGYRELPEVEKTIAGAASVLERLEADPRVRYAAPRVLTPATLATTGDLTGVQLVGVDPERERRISRVDEALVEGTFFGEGSSRELLLGARLAERLEAELGSRVVATVAEAGTGELRQELFEVTGIFRFGAEEFDAALAFIRLEKAQEMLGLGEGVHEIALQLVNEDLGWQRKSSIWQEYSTAGNEAAGWFTLLPELEMSMEIAQYARWILAVILFAIVALGIINTLMMAIFERRFEFGVLRAVGTRASQVSLMLVGEAAALGLVANLGGIALAVAFNGLLSVTGLDYTGIEAMGVTFQEKLYPVMSWTSFWSYPLLVWILTLLAAAYPAYRAARLRPAEALRLGG